MQIGLRAHDYGTNLSPEELAEILSEYKPCGIQLALAKSFRDAPKPDQITHGFARRVRKALEQKNISIAVLGCYINPVHPDIVIREKQLASFREHLRFVRDFGCPMVGTETGSCNGDCSYHPDTQKQETFDIFCRSLEGLVTTAEKCGSIVAIEAVADQHTICSVEKMEQVITRFASPALKIIYDPVNLIPAAGLLENQADFFTRAFNAFGKDIAAIHCKDFRMEAGQKIGTLPAGTGELDYPSLLRIIKERKPEIDLLLENSSPETGKEAMAFLTRLLSV